MTWLHGKIYSWVKKTQIRLESHTKSKILPGRQFRPLGKGLIPAPVGGGLIPAYHCKIWLLSNMCFKCFFELLRWLNTTIQAKYLKPIWLTIWKFRKVKFLIWMTQWANWEVENCEFLFRAKIPHLRNLGSDTCQHEKVDFLFLTKVPVFQQSLFLSPR